MLLDAERKRLLARAAYGLSTERMHALSFRVGEGVAGWVIERGEPALITDVAQDPRFVALPETQTQSPITSMLCVPLLARGERGRRGHRDQPARRRVRRKPPRARPLHRDDDRARHRERPPPPRRRHRPADRRVQPRVPDRAAAAGDRGRDGPRPHAVGRDGGRRPLQGRQRPARPRRRRRRARRGSRAACAGPSAPATCSCATAARSSWPSCRGPTPGGRGRSASACGSACASARSSPATG